MMIPTGNSKESQASLSHTLNILFQNLSVSLFASDYKSGFLYGFVNRLFQERLLGPREASMVKMEGIKTIMQSLLSHPMISFTLELKGLTGKAGMLDEIIEYVQSLQRHWRYNPFLSMKLATINPRVEFNPITALSSEVLQPGESLTQSLYATACTEQTLPSGHCSLAKNMPRFSDMQSPRWICSS
ncbi:hypothetical protein Bca4012_023815 [Brassica carinata]|uniref:Uncharacterized protein n=1 Tax=Brassica carinata TaxID=52824 RepID=A0A8X7NS51_BRACI|nr:hypothetical protein Bca52824_089904 [Brassica carinata]